MKVKNEDYLQNKKMESVFRFMQKKRMFSWLNNNVTVLLIMLLLLRCRTCQII